MIDDKDRYDRQIGLFGTAGQERIAAAHVGLVGLGGLGSHLAQQLAYLGIGHLTLVDGDVVSDHSLNRLVTALPDDVGAYKTELAERLIRNINPAAEVNSLPKHLDHVDPLLALRTTSLVIGGLDNDAARLQLTDIASTLRVIYIDAATDVHISSSTLVYGGRVVTGGVAPGCLYCLDLLDQREIRHARMTADEKTAEAAIYGVPVEALATTIGPSVVTINGVIASLTATEAMVCLTGLRAPVGQLVYRGDEGGVRINRDVSAKICPYCSRWARSAPK